jgi:hypothetical protein
MSQESAKESAGGKVLASDAAGLELSSAQRLSMLALNYLAFLHLLGVGLVIGFPWAPWGWRLAAGAAALYLAPPLAARVIRAVAPIREGRIRVGSRDFFTWWALANLQMVFCRLPMIEEVIRLVPGLYTPWLRLWGARVGRLTYWGAGLRILDRSFLRIGDEVVFGAAVRLNPHVLARNEKQQLGLILATIVVGDRAVIGGYSLLTAGTEIAPNECTRAFLVSPPFGKWQGGVRISKSDVQP